jgi:hypothetical protein
MGAKTGGASAVVDTLPIFLRGSEYVDVHILNIIDMNRVFGAHVRRIPRDDPETSRHATKRYMIIWQSCIFLGTKDTMTKKSSGKGI